MRAIVIATGEQPALPGVDLRLPAPLLSCIDRPALQHLVEAVVERGVTSFDFILHEAPDEIEAFLGDGKRWGAKFRFQLARSAEHPYRMLKLLESDDTVLLADASCLPLLDAAEYAAEKANSTALYYSAPDAEGSAPRWTGWARVTPQALAALTGQSTRAELEAALLAHAGAEAAVTTASQGWAKATGWELTSVSTDSDGKTVARFEGPPPYPATAGLRRDLVQNGVDPSGVEVQLVPRVTVDFGRSPSAGTVPG